MAAIATLRPAPASNPGMRGLPLLFALLCATPVLAVDPSSAAPATIPRLGAAIAIDGVLDEPAWQQAASIAVDNEIEPGDNIRGPATAILRTVDHLNLTAQWAQSRATDEQLDAVTDLLLLTMHDLRTVLVRRKADRLMRGGG